MKIHVIDNIPTLAIHYLKKTIRENIELVIIDCLGGIKYHRFEFKSSSLDGHL